MNLSLGVLNTGYTGMKKTAVLKEVQVLPNSVDRISQAVEVPSEPKENLYPRSKFRYICNSLLICSDEFKNSAFSTCQGLFKPNAILNISVLFMP
jgi:hypothetical protein